MGLLWPIYLWVKAVKIMSFAQLITRVVITQTNGRRQAFFSKKGVDAKRSYTHNAPRNADEGCAKKDGYVAQLVRAHHS